MRQTWPTGIVPVHKEPLVDPEVREVVTGLLEEFPVEQVVDAALADVRAEVPDFLAIDPEQMREDVSGALVLAVAVIRNGVDRGGLEGDALRSIGAMRAEQGVDIDAMLAGFRIVARTAIEAVLDLAASQGVDAGVTLELTRAVWLHCDEAAAALATGHRGFTESAALTSTSTSTGEAPLRRLVHGGLGPASVLEACAELGRAPAAAHVVVVAREPGGPGRDRLLASYTDSGAGRLVGLATTPPRDPWGVPVGFGDEVLPGDLRLSFEGALVAFEMADTFGLADPQHPDDVRLLRAVHEQPGFGDAFVERCFGHLDEPRRAAARQTLQAWFAAHGSVDAAADALFVHRNTLRYRLRTYAESAGLNLDRPEDAFTVWWALRRLDEREHLV
jgi:putative transposase